jgi:hypothetical protein
MHRPNLLRETEWSPVSRRQAILGIGSLAAGSTTLAIVATDESYAADVSMQSLSVADASFTAETITPKLVVDIGFSYDVGTAPIDSIEFTLSVDGTEVDRANLSTSSSVYEGTEQLSGLLTDSDAWAAADFEPAVGETVEQTVTATVSFDVLDSGGSAIVSDTATDDAVVSVAHPQETTYTATVGGSGEIIDASQ